MSPLTIRRLEPSDIEAATGVFVAASHTQFEPDAIARVAETFRYLVSRDPARSWGATVDGAVAGFALAVSRGTLMTLAALYVAPQAQSAGVGGALLRRCMDDRGAHALILSSGDSQATRLYAAEGLELEPTVYASGRPQLPAALDRSGTRDATTAHLDLMASVDTRVRGEARVDDLRFLLEQGTAGVVVDDSSGQGYALYRRGIPPVDGCPLTLVADSTSAARRLLRAVLDRSDFALVNGLTAAHGWAIEVALEARLKIRPGGPRFSKGAPAPTWLPAGFFG